MNNKLYIVNKMYYITKDMNIKPEEIYIIKYKKKIIGYSCKNDIDKTKNEHIIKYGHLLDFEYIFSNYSKSQFFKYNYKKI